MPKDNKKIELEMGGGGRKSEELIGNIRKNSENIKRDLVRETL